MPLIHTLLQGKFSNNVTVFVISDNSFVINYGNSSTNQCCSRECQRRRMREMAPVYYCWNISSSWVRSPKDFCARRFLTARNFSKLRNFLLVIIFPLCVILPDSTQVSAQREYLMKKHNFCSHPDETWLIGLPCSAEHCRTTSMEGVIYLLIGAHSIFKPFSSGSRQQNWSFLLYCYARGALCKAHPCWERSALVEECRSCGKAS